MTNEAYMLKTGKNWKCLTANSLVFAIEKTIEDIEAASDRVKESLPKDKISQVIIKKVRRQLRQEVVVI